MKKRIGENFIFSKLPLQARLKSLGPSLVLHGISNDVKQKINFFKSKKGIISEYLPWLLIAIAILVILMLAIFMLKGKGISILDKLPGLFRRR
jgi:hypothetical protein